MRRPLAIGLVVGVCVAAAVFLVFGSMLGFIGVASITTLTTPTPTPSPTPTPTRSPTTMPPPITPPVMPPLTPGEGIATPTRSIIQINSAPAGGTSISVQLISPGTDPTINAIYVTPLDGAAYGGALTTRIEFSPATGGTVVSVDIQKVEGGAGKILTAGDVIKVVCVDAGATSTTVT